MIKKLFIIISYWIVAVLLISAVLVSLNYEFYDSLFISLMMIPGCIVLKFILPKVSFSDLKKGIIDACFLISAVLVSELMFMLCTHVAVRGLDGNEYGFIDIDIPSVLINPAFLAVIMAFVTGGDYLLSRYLKLIFKKETTPISFTSDYKKVTLDISEILYVESRDTEVWVYATDGRRFRNKTGITQWENLLGDDFIRVHRSYVVKKNAIASVANESVNLQDGTLIPVSRKYKDSVSERT